MHQPHRHLNAVQVPVSAGNHRPTHPHGACRRIADTQETNTRLKASIEAIHRLGAPANMISNQGSQRNFFAGTDRLRRASGHIQMDSKYRRINHDCCINIRFIESQLTVTETRMRLPARTPPRRQNAGVARWIVFHLPPQHQVHRVL